MAQSHVFAAVGGYYGAKDKGGMAGVFRHEVGGSGWTYALKELETFTVFVQSARPEPGVRRHHGRRVSLDRFAARPSSAPIFPTRACRSGRS